MNERYHEEQAKLTTFIINGVALALIISGLVGPFVPQSSENSLTGPAIRTICGIVLHLVAKLVLRVMWPKLQGPSANGSNTADAGVGDSGGGGGDRGRLDLPETGPEARKAMTARDRAQHNWFR
jgi:hypothetical protein